MFGYVTVNKPEIKFKDFDMYRSFYCGLCRELRERYGIPGQVSLTYDMTFVVLLLSGLYEPPTREGKIPLCRPSAESAACAEKRSDRVLRRYECDPFLL